MSGREFGATLEEPGRFRYRRIYHSSGFGPDEGMTGVLDATPDARAP